MTTESAYSFVYDRQSADAGFHGIGIRELVLSLLAGMTPGEEWEGCRVFEGESPAEAGTVCIGIGGSGAADLQLQLVASFEKQGVRIVAVYEGGPEPRMPIARAEKGLWVTPDR